MAWNSNLRKGVDLPTWDWLTPFPAGSSYHGTANTYDGVRFMYWLVQWGNSGAASTTYVFRYDTWTEAWQLLFQTTNSYSGADLFHDPIRNVLIMTSGNGGTEWRIFNLGTASVSMLGQTFSPYTITSVTNSLPLAASNGASLKILNGDSLIDARTGSVATGSTTTMVNNTEYVFNQGNVGQRLRFTSGTYSGQVRTISAVSASGITATLSAALAGTPSAGDSFVVEYQQGTATGTQSATTLQDTTQAWTTNQYANHDVVILSGTGAGQRRRIASNTATTLNLTSTVNGNNRTGNWTTNPDATSVYKIVPSTDFLYYMAGNGTGFYKIDLNTGTISPAWVTLAATPAAVSGGGDLTYCEQQSPYVLHALRGNGSNSIYQYNPGLNTWVQMPTTYMGSETFNTGSGFEALHDHGRLVMHVNSTTRLLAYRLSDGFLEPAGTLPYAAPANYDGHRLRYIKTADGVPWLYVLRAGGQEFYRLALEWL